MSVQRPVIKENRSVGIHVLFIVVLKWLLKLFNDAIIQADKPLFLNNSFVLLFSIILILFTFNIIFGYNMSEYILFITMTVF
jgi:hypothetical protein